MEQGWGSLRGPMLRPTPGGRAANDAAQAQTPVSPPPDHTPDTAQDGTLALGWFWNANLQEWQLARIADEHRATHLFTIGATGAGKTKFLLFSILQDIQNGNGIGIIDPHGDMCEEVKGFLVEGYRRTGRESDLRSVVIVDPTDPEYTATFNLLEQLPGVSPAEQAQELLGAFKHIWEDSWGPRMSDMLLNSLIALGEAELTLGHLPHLLTDKRFRTQVLEKVTHPITRAYFARFEQLPPRYRLVWMEAVMNKVNAFLSDDRVRLMLSQPKSSFNLREIMDNHGVLLVKVDRGKLRESADLVGALFMAKIQMAVFSRSDIPPSRRVPWFLYVDEFQRFASSSFSITLSEVRKYAISIAIGNQTLEQIPPDVRSVILGNAGIQVYFRINRQDAETLAKEGFTYSGYQVKSADLYGPSYWSLGEEWERYYEELQRLPPRHCYVSHKIAGGMVHLRTATIRPYWETLGMSEEEWPAYLAGLELGRDHWFAAPNWKTRCCLKAA